MSADITLSSDLPTLTAEIHAYKRVAGEAIFEIGRRLKDVRDNPSKFGLVGYREWERWCVDEIDMSRNHANKFIKVFEEFGASGHPNLGVKALYEIATLPPEERERPHTIPSTGEARRPDEMTVRELREVKAALKAEREAREQAEADRDKAEEDYELIRDTLESVREQPPQVEYAFVEESASDPLRVTGDVRINGNVQLLSESIGDLLERFGYFRYYGRQIDALGDRSKAELMESIMALEEFLSVVKRGLQTKGTIIEI